MQLDCNSRIDAPIIIPTQTSLRIEHDRFIPFYHESNLRIEKDEFCLIVCFYY